MTAVVLVALAAWASVADARSRTIPNTCCVAVAACGLVLQAVRVWWPGHAAGLPEPVACVGWAAGILVVGVGGEFLLRTLTGRVGVGLGDVKYVAAWACTLGWYVLAGLGVACLLGAAWALARRQSTFAMAPWLSAAFVFLLLTLGIPDVVV